MTRPLQLLIVLAAAILCAGYTAWAVARQRVEVHQIEEDWGMLNLDGCYNRTSREGDPSMTFTVP